MPSPSLEHSALFDVLRVEITMTHSIETIAFYFEMAFSSDKNGVSVKKLFYKTYVKLFRRITEALTEFLFEGNASRTFLVVKKISKQIKVHFCLAAKDLNAQLEIQILNNRIYNFRILFPKLF